MICPKCGKEYEGDKCPNCSGPKIIVNESDYQKRKIAYEKKQTAKRSASLTKEKNSVSLTDKADSDSKESIADSLNKIREKSVKAVFSKAKDVNVRIREKKNNKSKAASFVRRHRKMIGFAFILIAVVATIVFGICNIASRSSSVLYVTSNDKIYDASKSDRKDVCSASDAVFAADGNTFYTPQFPDDLDKSKMISSIASDNGKYFAAALYDEESFDYTVFVWNDQECKKITQGKKQKDIKYVSDQGTLIYTDTDVVNSEGAIGGIELYVYSDSKGLLKIEENLRKVNIYTKLHQIIYQDKSYSLCIYDYETGEKKGISDDVKNVYVMSDEEDNVFTYKAPEVNTSQNANAIVYSFEGKYFYHILNNDSKKNVQDRCIARVSDSRQEFIVEADSYIYMIDNGQLNYASINEENDKDTVPEYALIDSLTASLDYIYMAKDKKLVYINDKNQLTQAERNNKKVCSEELSPGTLKKVKNTDRGITFLKGDAMYYKKTPTSDESKIKDNVADVPMVSSVLYKNKLYFFGDENRLYSSYTDGRDCNEIGNVDRYWIGKEMKVTAQ